MNASPKVSVRSLNPDVSFMVGFVPWFAYAALSSTWTWGSVTQKEIAGNIVVVLEYDHAGFLVHPRCRNVEPMRERLAGPDLSRTRRFLHKRMITGQSELHPIDRMIRPMNRVIVSRRNPPPPCFATPQERDITYV
jgi:hypothetical protein